MTPEQLAPLVRATVLDLRIPSPTLATSYLVDTNVLYFCYYQRHVQHEALGRGPLRYQTTLYPNYEKRVREAGGRLGVSRSILVEFLHRIEGAELTILHAVLDPNAIGGPRGLPRKEIRERGYLAHRLEPVREQVKIHLDVIQRHFHLLSDPPWTIPFVGCLYEEWSRGLIDATDAALVSEAKAAGIPHIISDDAEFCAVPDIRLYTANHTAINAARQAGRLG
jgi:hypothetical protein